MWYPGDHEQGCGQDRIGISHQRCGVREPAVETAPGWRAAAKSACADWEPRVCPQHCAIVHKSGVFANNSAEVGIKYLAWSKRLRRVQARVKVGADVLYRVTGRQERERIEYEQSSDAHPLWCGSRSETVADALG